MARRNPPGESEGQPFTPAAVLDGEGSGIAFEATRQDLRLARRAIRRGWPVGQRAKRTVVDMAVATVEDTSQKTILRLAAAKVLILADAINVRRERNALDESTSAARTEAMTMSAVLRSPEARAALAALTGQLCGPGEADAPPGEVPGGPAEAENGPAPCLAEKPPGGGEG